MTTLNTLNTNNLTKLTTIRTTNIQHQVNKWLNNLLNVSKKSPNTVCSYKNNSNNLITYFNSINIHNVDEITVQHLFDYIEYLTSTKNYANRTVNQHIASLNLFFSYLKAIKLIEVNIALEIHSIGTTKTVPRSLELNEAKQLQELASEKNIRDSLIIDTLLLTGLRVSELVTLNHSDIRNGILLVKHGKGDKQREISVPEELLTKIELYRLHKKAIDKYSGDSLFISNRRTQISKRRVQVICTELLHSVNGEKLVTHEIRKTFASLLYESGVSIYTIKGLLGHSSIEVTQMYIRESKKVKQEAIMRNPLLG